MENLTEIPLNQVNNNFLNNLSIDLDNQNSSKIIPIKEWLHYFMDDILPIKEKDIIILDNMDEKIWIEVVTIPQFLKMNKNKQINSRLYLGKIISRVASKPYYYGSFTLFEVSQVYFQETYDNIMKMISNSTMTYS
jgi:hypothetical protein